MRKLFSLLILGSAVFMYQSCYYDKGTFATPATTSSCDSAGTISYSQKVVPILQQNCYSCHLSSSTGGGYLMGTYTREKNLATGSRFMGAIKQLSGYSAMPKGGTKLSDCQIAIIQKWINQGCLNN